MIRGARHLRRHVIAALEKVRKDRGRFVSAVLTVIKSWQAMGCPRGNVDNVATFGHAWADYCRHPLIWLGYADPATALLNQVRHDPDAEALGTLMKAWDEVFGSAPTTVRKAIQVAEASDYSKLNEAIEQLPVIDRNRINPGRLGWYLRKNANRIVGEFEFREAEADGRKAWRVMTLSPPLSPLSPPSTSVALARSVNWSQDL